MKRDELIEKAKQFSQVEAYCITESYDVFELMADFALSVQPKPIDWDGKIKEYFRIIQHMRHHWTEYEVLKDFTNYLSEQPEFKQSEPPRKEE